MSGQSIAPSRGTALARLAQFLQYSYLWSTLPVSIRNLRERGTVSDWVKFALSSPFVPIQVRAEITTLIDNVAARQPRTVLEIGTEGGGTLLLLTLAAASNATIISIDMPTGRFGGYPPWKAPYYRRFALPSQRLHLVRANSHALRTLQHVRTILAGSPLDVLFVDGDHSYGGVRADWEMYGPLVAPDGLVAFHDIVPHPPEMWCDVHEFWQELKTKFEHWEIIADRAQSWGGIGVIGSRRGSRATVSRGVG